MRSGYQAGKPSRVRIYSFTSGTLVEELAIVPHMEEKCKRQSWMRNTNHICLYFTVLSPSFFPIFSSAFFFPPLPSLLAKTRSRKVFLFFSHNFYSVLLYRGDIDAEKFPPPKRLLFYLLWEFGWTISRTQEDMKTHSFIHSTNVSWAVVTMSDPSAEFN